MAINATTNSAPRELIEAGLHMARCYKMVQVGTVRELFKGEYKTMQKIRIGWELPELLKVFKEGTGPQPRVFEQEFTLSMGEKANLRKILTSWRGRAFTEEEAKCFDVTKLIGVPCLLNITHKPSKSDPTKIYEDISGITPLMKGQKCPPQVNPSFILSFDEWDENKFNSLPDFVKDKIKTSLEYQAMQTKAQNLFVGDDGLPKDLPADFYDDEDIPF